MLKIVFSLFILGLSFGSGPCIASCGPLLISYAAGTEKNILKSIWVYVLFSLSRIAVYLILSLLIFALGQVFSEYNLGNLSRFLFILAGLFIIFIGLLVILGKNLDHKLCHKMQNIFIQKDAKTVIMLGLIIGILPCAPLITVVSYIGLIAKHWFNTVIYSLSFGLGTVFSPLLVLLIFTGLIPKFIKKERVYRIFNLVCGLIIVFLGVQLIRRVF